MTKSIEWLLMQSRKGNLRNATDDYKMKKGKPAFTIPSPTGSMIIKVWLRPMAKPAPKTMMAFNYELEDKK